MGWDDPSETIIAGAGEVYVAPVGTALPTTADAVLNAAFNGLGYHTEDGVSVNQAVEIVEHRAWQSRYPVRRVRDNEDFQLSFVLMQWNEVNVPLAFGGGEIVLVSAGQYRFNPPVSDDGIDERALICDVIDGARKVRFVIPKGGVVEAVESAFTRTEMANLPITFKALQPDDGSMPWYFLANDAAAYAAGS